MLDREKMKVSFDKEAIDYLVNDMTYVFRERQYSIDSNQVNINFYKKGKNSKKFWWIKRINKYFLWNE